MQRQAFLEDRKSFPIKIYEGEIGEKRRERVYQALQNLSGRRGQKSILGFLPASKRSFDFYVIFVREDKYRFLRLSVTSRYWLETMRKMHPDNNVIAVDLIELIESIENKIIKEIMSRKYSKY